VVDEITEQGHEGAIKSLQHLDEIKDTKEEQMCILRYKE
jgi:hypothetical protein